MNPLLNIAVDAVRAAGKIILKASERPDLVKVSFKSEGYVTDVDIRAEEAMIQIIKKAYPDHKILAEESGIHGDHDIVWIIDALDGTKNFVHEFPHYAVSLAIKINEKITHAVIYDPVREELFIASAGRGAQLNGRRIRVSQRSPEYALIATAYPHATMEEGIHWAKITALLTPMCSTTRRMGSAALDLAYLAAGRVDVCVMKKLKLWDFAAGVLLITEAGGLISDWRGDESYWETGEIYAAHPKLFKFFLKVLS